VQSCTCFVKFIYFFSIIHKDFLTFLSIIYFTGQISYPQFIIYLLLIFSKYQFFSFSYPWNLYFSVQYALNFIILTIIIYFLKLSNSSTTIISFFLILYFIFLMFNTTYFFYANFILHSIFKHFHQIKSIMV
jgi:hypothetical protein